MEEKVPTVLCKMGDLVMGNQAFNMLRMQRMNVRASLQIRRITKAMEAEGEIFNEAHQELIDMHADKNKNGERIVEDDAVVMVDRDAFDLEFDELMDTGVDLGVHPLKLSWLEGVQLSPHELELLMFLFEDDLDG